MVEAALILPAFVFVLLLAVQLTQLQRARILADYAAFAAARAGIVMNGDPGRMHDAAALALLPSVGPTDDLADIARTLARFTAREALLPRLGLEPLRILVHNPVAADFRRFGQHLGGLEIDFDDVRPAAADATLLSLEVRYLYELHVPFANRVIQEIWLASTRTPLPALAGAALAGHFYLPLRAFYTMRMQSNPFLRWAHP